MIAITLPDQSVRQFENPVSVAEVAASIGAGLAKAALAGKVDGKVVDTSFVIDRDVALAIVTDRDAEGLEIIRHSTAHLLAFRELIGRRGVDQFRNGRRGGRFDVDAVLIYGDRDDFRAGCSQARSGMFSTGRPRPRGRGDTRCTRSA